MKLKKGIIFLVMCVLGLGLIVVGCGKSGEQNVEQEQGAAKLTGNIQIAGSTSVQPLAEELATVFMEKNPDVKIDVQGGGSSAGVKAAAEGVADIGMASRKLKADEESLGITPIVIANDGIAVVINSGNAVENLTMENIKGIFAGEITNWQEVGGENTPIVVINREEGSGTRGAFEEIVLGKEGKFTESAAIQNSTGAVRTAVSSDPNAIGYISMGSMDQSVKAVKVDDVEANEENVLNGTYKIARPFNFLTKGEQSEVVKAFVEWILSSEGQETVSEEFIPVK